MGKKGKLAMDIFFCENCGAKCDADAMFCENCGNRLDSDEKAPVTEAAAAPVKIKTDDKPAPPPAPTEKPEAPAESVKPAAVVTVMEKPASQPTAAPAERSSSARIVSLIVSILLSALIFFNIVSGVGVLIVQSLISEENIRSLCDDTDLSDLRVGNLINFDGLEDVSDGSTLPQWISANLDPVAVSKYGMTADGVAEILEKSTLKDFVRDNLLEAAAYMRGDEADASITVDEMIKLLEDNADVIYNATGYKFIDEDYDNFRAFLKDSGAFEDSDTLSLASDGGLSVRGIRLGMSVYALVILGVITLVMIIILFILNRQTLRSVLLYTGIPLTLAGLFFTVCGIGAGLFTELACSDSGFDVRFAEKTVGTVRTTMILSGLCALLTGAVLIIIFVIAVCLKKRKQFSENL